MSVPWLHHQRTSGLKIVIVTKRPMGTSCPSRRGGRTMTSMATWTMPCTTATLTPLSTTTWSGRLGVCNSTSSHQPSGSSGGHCGKGFLPFSSASAPLSLSHWKSDYSRGKQGDRHVGEASVVLPLLQPQVYCVLVLWTKLSANVQALNFK